MFGLVPGLQVISSYRREWLLRDVIAGVVLTTLLVPQGMAPAPARPGRRGQRQRPGGYTEPDLPLRHIPEPF